MGNIYLYTGNGGGKTTNALGLALRALGHGQSVLMIQFLKWEKNTGELLFSEKWNSFVGDAYGIYPEFIIKQFGRKGWHGFNNLTQEDKNLCKKGLDYTLKLLKKRCKDERFDLLILDEINLIAHLKLVDLHELLSFLVEITYKYPDVKIVMTGRYAPEEFIEIADVVNEVNEVKAPKTFIYEEGIQY